MTSTIKMKRPEIPNGLHWEVKKYAENNDLSIPDAYAALLKKSLPEDNEIDKNPD